MAAVTLLLSGPTRRSPSRSQALDCEAGSLADALAVASAEFDLTIVNPRSGGIASGFTVFLNGADVRLSSAMATPLAEGDRVSIVSLATDT